jgi:hypothetical protein
MNIQITKSPETHCKNTYKNWQLTMPSCFCIVRPAFKVHHASYSKKYKLSFIKHRLILGVVTQKNIKKACLLFGVSSHLALY